MEVLGQYAQLKSVIFGDFSSSVNLLKTALEHARTREEVTELTQVSNP